MDAFALCDLNKLLFQDIHVVFVGTVAVEKGKVQNKGWSLDTQLHTDAWDASILVPARPVGFIVYVRVSTDIQILGVVAARADHVRKHEGQARVTELSIACKFPEVDDLEESPLEDCYFLLNLPI